MRSDEERFRDGETLNQIDGVGSWAGHPVEYAPAPDDDVEPYLRDEICPDCQGDGFEDYGGTCPSCGGSGWLPAS